MITTIPGLINALGGAASLANELGVERQAVAMWVVRGFVPNAWHMRLFLLCCERTIALAPSLFDLPGSAFDVVSRYPAPSGKGVKSSSKSLSSRPRA